MAKFVLLFLVICISSFVSADDHEEYGLPAAVEDTHDHTHNYLPVYSAPIAGEVIATDEDYTELYSVFASSVFDFVAKFIRAKVDVVLWIKKFVILAAVQVIGPLNSWVATHGDQVHGILRAVVEVIKVFGAQHNGIPYY